MMTQSTDTARRIPHVISSESAGKKIEFEVCALDSNLSFTTYKLKDPGKCLKLFQAQFSGKEEEAGPIPHPPTQKRQIQTQESHSYTGGSPGLRPD